MIRVSVKEDELEDELDELEDELDCRTNVFVARMCSHQFDRAPSRVNGQAKSRLN